MVFLNCFLSMLNVFEKDGRLLSNNTSFSLFDSYSFWIFSRAACERHQIQTTTVFLFSWELRISMPSSFSWERSWCDLGLFLFRRSLKYWWISSCASVDVVNFSARACTSIFITPEKIQISNKILRRNFIELWLN